jgi:hypothetical protein
MWIRIISMLNVDPDPDRIQEGKSDLQTEKKVKNFHVLKWWMFFFEG